MANLSFGSFVWPNDPEKYEEKAVREPVYIKDAEGNAAFSGMSALMRKITGSGYFFGTGAWESFKALLAMMGQTEPANLNHPVWGSRQAYLTELTSTMEPREDFVAYSFTFLEANSDGTVPK